MYSKKYFTKIFSKFKFSKFKNIFKNIFFLMSLKFCEFPETPAFTTNFLLYFFPMIFAIIQVYILISSAQLWCIVTYNQTLFLSNIYKLLILSISKCVFYCFLGKKNFISYTAKFYILLKSNLRSVI